MKHCTSATLSLVCLLLACHGIDVQAETVPQESTEHSTVQSKVNRPLPTLIVAGQSNAFRLGRLALGKGVSAGAKFCHFANSNCVKASDLNARVRTFSGDQKLGGSGAGIVQALGAEYPEGFAVICYAVCGSNLHTQWMPTEQGGYYKIFFDPFVAKGLKEIEQASGRKPNVVGMLWHQGESNSGSPTEVDAYAHLMPAVTANFRKTYGQVPIVLGEIREFDDQPNRAAINKHMHTIAKHESGVGVVELQDAGWESPTNVHFSGKGASVAGWRLVAEWITQREVLSRL